MHHFPRLGAAAIAAMGMLGSASGCERGAERGGDDGTSEVDVASAEGAMACPGACLFARELESPPEAEPSSIHAMDLGVRGEIVLAGELRGEVDFGGASLAPVGEPDAFVVKLDRCGDLLWSKAFGDSGRQRALDVEVAPAGDVIVMGRFTGAIDFGTGPLTGQEGQIDAFVARLDPRGEAVWAKHVTGGFPAAIAVDREGNTVLIGDFEGVVDLGDSRVESRAPAGFIAKIDAAGHTVWSARLPTGTEEAPIDVEIAPSGRIFVGGEHARGIGLFVLALSPAGAVVWETRFRAPVGQQNERFTDLAVSRGGRPRIAGIGYLGTVEDPGTRYSPFVAELDDAGDLRWIARSDVPWSRITATAGGATLAAGTTCAPEGAPCELVLTELDRSGNERESRRFEGSATVTGLEADARRAVMAGSFEGVLRLPPEPLQSAGSSLFVAAVPR